MNEIPLIRPAREEDLEKLYSFAIAVGFGFTSLPPDREAIKRKIAHSIESFSKSIFKPKNESYLFVLQLGDKIIGCSALVSKIGMEEPFYAYHLRKESYISEALDIKREVPILTFIEATKKPTEVGTLFLEKEYRKREMGKLLSLSRFLFVASKRVRFAPRVIGELRGYVDAHGRSPFWEAIGRHFFDLSYEKAIQARYRHPEIIDELFPKHPIYPWLLPKEASAVIGALHPDTWPAKKLLEKQGFTLTTYYDLFDAGPHMFAPTDEIIAVKASKECVVSEIHDGPLPNKPRGLLANTHLDFRATFTPLFFDEQGGLILTKNVASLLSLEEGDKARFYYLS